MAETLRIEIPIKTVDETEPELSNLIKKIGKLGEEADKAGRKTKKSSEYVTEFDKRARKTEQGLQRWAKEKYEVLLEAKEKITPVLSTVGRGLKSIAGKAWSVTMRAVDLVTSPVRGIMNLLKNPVFQVGAVLGVTIGLKDTVDTYKGFEAAMSQVQAVSGATGSEVTKLSDKAKEMGATTKFTAAESAEAFNYMAMAGWKTGDMLNGIEGILSLAAASGEDLGTTSDIVTDALTAFGLQAGDAGHFADVLAQASSNANTNVGMLGESFKYVAPVAGAMKYSVEDVSLALGLMANASVKGSMAGTALKTALANIAAPTAGMAAAMNKYGISLTDSKGNMKTLKEVLDNLRKGLGGLAEAEQTAAASTIFGKEAMAGMLSVINASEQDYNKLTEAVNHAQGAAAGMSDIMLDNLQGSMILLQSAVDGVKISLGKRLSPYVRSLADWLKEEMPAVEQWLGSFMDRVETRFDSAKRKFAEISGTREWQEADFFGKVTIAWDQMIADPFLEWWNSVGKAKFAGYAQDIGHGIGSGLRIGIMTLLGLTTSETVNEGANIGASFAKGFSEGFDFEAVAEKLWQGFKGMLSSAGKFLPGGDSPDLSSFLSLMMLAKVGKPVFGFGSSVFNMGRLLFGSSESGGLGLGGSLRNMAGSKISSLGSRILGTTGNAMVSGSGILGKFADVGYKVSGGSATPGMYFGDMSGAMSGGAAAAAGMATAAGVVSAGATLVSGAVDIYKAVKSDKSDERAAYKASAGLKAGGVAAGAAIGTLILPGVGTAIGAGIGGIAGWIAGNKVKQGYEEELEKAEKAAANAQKVFDVTGLSMNEIRFANEDLQAAMEDTEVSAEQFAMYLQENMAKVAKEAFGDIHLSLEEVKELAAEITFGDMKEGLEEFNTAAADTENALSVLKGSISEIKKQNWQVAIGMKLTESEKEDYKKSVDSFVESVRNYIKDSHYEATVALKLLLGNDTDLTGTNAFYGDLTSQVEEYSRQLQDVLDLALADGTVSTEDVVTVKIGGVQFELNEAEAIEELQNKLTGITDSLAQARNKTELDLIEMKYSGADLDAESFDSFLKETAEYRKNMEETADSAYQSAAVPLYAKIEDPSATEEEKAAARQELQKAKDARAAASVESNKDVLSFSLDTMAGAWATELDGILPYMQGTVQEKLNSAMSMAIAIKPNVQEWTQEDVAEWFGLEELARSEGEAFENIYENLQKIAATVPPGVKDKLVESAKNSIPTPEEILETVDFANWSADEIYEWCGGGEFSSNTAAWYRDMFADPNSTLEDIEGWKNFLAQKVYDNLTDSMNIENITLFKQVMEEARNSEAQVSEAGARTGAALLNGMQNGIEANGSLLRTSADNVVNNVCAKPFNVTAKINVTPEYNIMNAGGAGYDIGLNLLASRNATGGYVSGGPQLSWLAEEGYGEFVIPTNPSRRARALKLYEQAGVALGVSAHAAGGYVGGSFLSNTAANYNLFNEAKRSVPAAYSESTEGDYGIETIQTYTPPSSSMNGSAGDSPIQVSVNVAPEFVIHGGDSQNEGEIMQVIRKHMREMADELGGEIAGKLEEVFSNMPVKEAW